MSLTLEITMTTNDLYETFVQMNYYIGLEVSESYSSDNLREL